LHVFVVATTHVCKLLLRRISSHTIYVLNKSHGIEAMQLYHSTLYDILIINTRPQLCLRLV